MARPREPELCVRDAENQSKPLIALLALASLEAGCSGASLGGWSRRVTISSRRPQWFRRYPAVSIRNVSIDADTADTQRSRSLQEDLVSADGGCPGMAATANALTDGAAGAPPPSGTGAVALLHAE